MATSLDSYNPTLRFIEFINIPKESGDVVVLLLVHPGLNLLGRYLPPSKINDLLLADVHTHPTSSLEDVYMMDIEEPDLSEEMEVLDIIDLASFLEYVLRLHFQYSYFHTLFQVCYTSDPLPRGCTQVSPLNFPRIRLTFAQSRHLPS